MAYLNLLIALAIVALLWNVTVRLLAYSATHDSPFARVRHNRSHFQ